MASDTANDRTIIKRRKRIALFDLIHETIRQDKKEYNQKAYRQDTDMECKDFMKIM